MNKIFNTTRRWIYRLLFNMDTLMKRRTSLAILCYHSISDNEWRFSISFREFKKQMNYLSEHYRFISLEQVEAVIDGTLKLDKPAVAVTFDDGYKDLLTMKHILDDYQLHPTLFVLSDPERANREELGTQKELMNDLDLMEMSEFGCSIGSHTATHPNLTTLTSQQIKNEILGSKVQLEKSLVKTIPYIAYPRGKYNDQVLKAVTAAGYRMGLTMDDGIISPKTDKLRVPRIGVDNTHTFEEFKTLMSPSSVAFRKMVKNSFLGAYL